MKDPLMGLGLGLGGFAPLGNLQAQIGPRTGLQQQLQAPSVPMFDARLMAAHAEQQKRMEKMKAMMADPNWWVGRDVPPLEPFSRFATWIDLELSWVRRDE